MTSLPRCTIAVLGMNKGATDCEVWRVKFKEKTLPYSLKTMVGFLELLNTLATK